MTTAPTGPSATAREQLTADAVVTAYIHEISDRHRPADRTRKLTAAESARD